MRLGAAICCAAGALLALLPAGAAGAPPRGELVGTRTVAPGKVRMSFRFGPIVAAPGQNLILLGPVTIERPLGDGYVTRISPNMKRPDGVVPRGDRLHMHHAVAVNLSRRDATRPNLPERFFAFGEEKTISESPPGYGYFLDASDTLALNYMIHNLATQTEVVYITYELDWVAVGTPAAIGMKPARPIWMDVENGRAYPVFDVKRRSGGNDGRFTYPDDAPDPYGARGALNEWVVDRDGVLIGTGSHVHPGGLFTDLDLVRGERRKTIFHSEARYFDPNGPVSWDMAMTLSPPDWRVGVKRGDRLALSATYETERASWYESMGIGVAWMADGTGPNPFTDPPETRGQPSHGHLPENDNHGGEPGGAPDPAKLPDGQTLDDRVGIANFQYLPGGFALPGSFRNPPIVDRGQSLRFGNLDATGSIFHSVTACKAPCTGSTGVSYPLADGEGDFDSGQLGYGPGGLSAAANRAEWETPRDLDAGTYTYFCRVHPFMRGSFRVRGVRAASCAPRLAISRRAVRLRRRRAAIRLRCRGRGRCRGTLALSARSRGRRVGFGKRRFDLAAGRSRLVRVRVSGAGRRLTQRRGRLRLRATAVARRGGCRFRSTRATITLRRPR